MRRKIEEEKCVALFPSMAGEQGTRSGESLRFPPMWPGFSPGSPVFLFPQNPNCNLTKIEDSHENQRSRDDAASSLNIVFYLFNLQAQASGL